MGAAAPASLTVAALLLLACPHGVAALASTAAPASATGALANLVLYGEALCPDTAAWVARVLGPAVRNGTVVAPGAPGGPGALAAARFVGWGKATAAANGSAATCQHGTQVGPRKGGQGADGGHGAARRLVSRPDAPSPFVRTFSPTPSSGPLPPHNSPAS